VKLFFFPLTAGNVTLQPLSEALENEPEVLQAKINSLAVFHFRNFFSINEDTAGGWSVQSPNHI
jgi:hypothetical protein